VFGKNDARGVSSEPRTRTRRGQRREARGRERERERDFFSFVENKEEIERDGREIIIIIVSF